MITLNNTLKKSMAIVTITIASALSSISAFAYDDDDKAIIKQNIATMIESMNSGKMTPIIDMMSPKMFDQFSEIMDLPSSDVREMLIVQSNAMMQMLADDKTTMDYTAHFENAKVMQTSIGRDYVLIPTESHMVMKDAAVDMTGTLLAFEDGDQWYMMRIDNQMHLDLLNQAYADMEGIEMFEPTVQTFEIVDGVRQVV